MSKDPLEELHKISGVNALSVLTKDDKRIILLGNKATPAKKVSCAKCTKDCYTIKRLIDSLLDYHTKTKTEFDFYGQYDTPYSSNPAVMVKIIKQLAKSYKDDLLSAIQSEYAEELYNHKSTKNRFHYVDIRFIPYLALMGLDKFTPDKCYKVFILAYPNKSTINKILLQVCFELKDPNNKISKQYFKLPLAERKLVRKFIEKHIDNIHKNYSYPDMECIYNLTDVLMDCYTICRFLRFFAKQPAGSTSVFFEKMTFTWTISQFLKIWGCTVIYDSHPKNIYDYAEKDYMSKCITMK